MRYGVSILFVLMLGAMASALDEIKSPGIWFQPGATTPEKPRAVVLLAHGLNLKPSKMDSIAKLLQNSGASVLRITLTGHEDDSNTSMEAFKNVEPALWRNDFNLSYDEARAVATKENVPLYFVGFSLGGLVGMDTLLQDGSPVHFDRIVLLAPAMSLRSVSQLLHLLKLFGRGFCVPSANSPEYRVHHCTPMGAYAALLDCGKDVRSRNNEQVNVPTLIIGDPKDELVSLGGLKKLAQNKEWSSWKFLEVSGDETSLPKKIHHLIIDEAGAGKSNWNTITKALLSHLSL